MQKHIFLENYGNDDVFSFQSTIFKVGRVREIMISSVDRDLIGLPSGITFSQLRITKGNDSTLISAKNQLLVTLNGVNPDRILSIDFFTIV